MEKYKERSTIIYQEKINEPFNILLEEPTLEILKYYKNYYQSEDSYIFPILNEKYSSS